MISDIIDIEEDGIICRTINADGEYKEQPPRGVRGGRDGIVSLRINECPSMVYTFSPRRMKSWV
jgi:hypothetical protein